MISLIFFALAAVCNAVMDVIVHHWWGSIFNVYRANLGDDRRFIYDDEKRTKFKDWIHYFFSIEGCKNKYVDGDQNKGRKRWRFFGIKSKGGGGMTIVSYIIDIRKPVQICDAWHFFKMLMIIFLVCGALTFNCDILSELPISSTLKFTMLLVSYGFCWNVSFSLFYNKILMKRKRKL